MITQELKSASESTVRSALVAADPMALRGLLYHATGDAKLERIQLGRVAWAFNDVTSVTEPEDLELLREKAFELLMAYREGRVEEPTAEATEQLKKAIFLAAGEEVPDDEIGLHHDMLALDPTPRGWGAGPSIRQAEDFRVIVVGTGLAGIHAAIQLKASGIPFVVLEKNAGVGGTWFQNTYPGARVDWPSVLYSHSYGTKFDFRYAFAPQQHNRDYMEWCVNENGVRSFIQFNTEVTSMVWNEEKSLWHVRTRGPDGSEQLETANAVISAIGLQERPNVPAIPGMERFKGAIFHSARYDKDIDLSDKRVVVIGTGCSGMQMAPELAPLCKHVTVFQRTPSWVFPAVGYRDELPAEMQWLNRNFPQYRNWLRFVFAWNLGDPGLYKQFLVDPEWDEPMSVNADNHQLRLKLLSYLDEKLGDRPDLLEQCRPNYPVFGTRPVIDNEWFDAIKGDSVTLIGAGAVEITEDSVISSAGEKVPADVVIFATGFRSNEYFWPLNMVGSNGMTIDQVWAKDGPRTYWGITIPHFPNLFLMYGPNANPVNLGPVQYGEWAMHYFLDCFKSMIEKGYASMEVRQDAYDRYNVAMDKRLAGMVSVYSNLRFHKSYFTNEFGRSAVQSPWTSAEAREALLNVNFDDYIIRRPGDDVVDGRPQLEAVAQAGR